MPETITLETLERENMGRNYMGLAIQYGFIELKKGLSLYSSTGMESLGLKDSNGVKAAFPEGEFFFVQDKGEKQIIFDCYYPLHVIDVMESEESSHGFYLPIAYKSPDSRRVQE
jgi:hypothetical protein